MRDDRSGVMSTGAWGTTVGVPRHATLSGFGEAVAAAEGVTLRDVGALETLSVRTRNNLYRVCVLRPAEGDILIQGGRFFPQATRARLAGSSLGGSCLKLGWIGSGFQMEVHAGEQRVVTTRVQSVRIEDSPATPGPF